MSKQNINDLFNSLIKKTDDGDYVIQTNLNNSSGYKVKVSNNDTTENYLEDKLEVGDNITIETQNDGANETIKISTPNSLQKSTYDVNDNGIVDGAEIIISLKELDRDINIPENVNAGMMGPEISTSTYELYVPASSEFSVIQP